MADITIKIEGMGCGHCVKNVKKSLDSLDGVSSSDVEFGTQMSFTTTLNYHRPILKRPL
jgi:copper chaperone CopZ